MVVEDMIAVDYTSRFYWCTILANQLIYLIQKCLSTISQDDSFSLQILMVQKNTILEARLSGGCLTTNVLLVSNTNSQ